METDELIKILAIILGTGGLFGGLAGGYALAKKARPEAQNIIIESAKGAVIVHTGVIKDLEQELDRVNKENNDLREDNRKIKEEYDKVLRENMEIRRKLQNLEDQINALTKRTTLIEQQGNS